MKCNKLIKISRVTHISLIWVMLGFIFFISCVVVRKPAITQNDNVAYSIKVQGVELPFSRDSTFLIRNLKGRYTLKYDTTHRQARWVAYVLTNAECSQRGVGRHGRFLADPEVLARNWPSARTDNYTNSGFDRGHLLPSADRNGDRDENKTTFHLSNVAPQYPKLNRGVWKNLEEKVRQWAVHYDSLYVVTGTIMDQRPQKLKGSVSVPAAFYKALLMKHNGRWHSAAFYMPNAEPVNSCWSDYMITVRQLEDSSGVDFFYSLPPHISDRVESSIDRAVWY